MLAFPQTLPPHSCPEGGTRATGQGRVLSTWVFALLGHELPECRDCPIHPCTPKLARVCKASMLWCQDGRCPLHCVLVPPALPQGSHHHEGSPIGLHRLPPSLPLPDCVTPGTVPNSPSLDFHHCSMATVTSPTSLAVVRIRWYNPCQVFKTVSGTH